MFSYLNPKAASGLLSQNFTHPRLNFDDTAHAFIVVFSCQKSTTISLENTNTVAKCPVLSWRNLGAVQGLETSVTISDLKGKESIEFSIIKWIYIEVKLKLKNAWKRMNCLVRQIKALVMHNNQYILAVATRTNSISTHFAIG